MELKGLTFSKKEEEVPKEEIKTESLKRELWMMMSKIPEPNKTKMTNLLAGSKFFEAPASTKKEFHGAWPGGLAMHTISLIRHMATLNEAWECGLSDGQMALVGILHDFSKAGFDGKDYYMLQESKWHQEKLGQKYKYNTDLPALGQNAMSLYIAQKNGIELDVDEYQAILGQDGLFSDEGKSVWMAKNGKPCKLAFVLHFSDFYTSAVHKV